MISLSEQMEKLRGVVLLNEAWDKKMDTPDSKKGMFKGKSKEDLKSELSAAKKKSKKHHDDGTKEPESLKTKIKELEFALRAKNKFGKVNEDTDLDECDTCGKKSCKCCKECDSYPCECKDDLKEFDLGKSFRKLTGGEITPDNKSSLHGLRSDKCVHCGGQLTLHNGEVSHINFKDDEHCDNPESSDKVKFDQSRQRPAPKLNPINTPYANYSDTFESKKEKPLVKKPGPFSKKFKKVDKK